MNEGIIVAGGIVPEEDKKTLADMGLKKIFGPGTSTESIREFILRELQKRDSKNNPND